MIKKLLSIVFLLSFLFLFGRTPRAFAVGCTWVADPQQPTDNLASFRATANADRFNGDDGVGYQITIKASQGTDNYYYTSQAEISAGNVFSATLPKVGFLGKRYATGNLNLTLQKQKKPVDRNPIEDVCSKDITIISPTETAVCSPPNVSTPVPLNSPIHFTVTPLTNRGDLKRWVVLKDNATGQEKKNGCYNDTTLTSGVDFPAQDPGTYSIILWEGCFPPFIDSGPNGSIICQKNDIQVGEQQENNNGSVNCAYCPKGANWNSSLQKCIGADGAANDPLYDTCTADQFCVPGHTESDDGVKATCYNKSTFGSVGDAPRNLPCSSGNSTNMNCNYILSGLGINLNTDMHLFISKLLGVILSLSGGIAILLIIISGYRLMVTQGNPEKIQAAREQLTAAIVGLLFIIFSLVIIQVIGYDILQLPGFGQ